MEIASYRYMYKEGFYPFHKWVGYEMKVEFLGEAKKWVRIKFLGYHADGRPPGTITQVKAKSVKRYNLKDTESRAGSDADVKKYFEGLDPELIRKPYKDD